MPFPSTEREIYARNPLAEVICQLTFPTILRIAAEPPADFQDALRDRYPVFRQEQDGPAGIPPEMLRALGDLPGQLQGETNYFFESDDGDRMITLSRESVAVTHRNYPRWEDFKSELELAKTAVEAIYGPSFYERIGLRYQNVIDRSEVGLEDTPWGDLISTPMAGLFKSDDDVLEDLRTTVSISTFNVHDVDGGTVMLRHGLASHENREIFAVDADFSTTERIPNDEILGILDRFNVHAGNLFRWSITDSLRDALGPS